MATLESIGDALFMQPDSGDPDITYSGVELRGLFTALVDTEGIIGSNSLEVHPRLAGANFTVEIEPGNAAVDGDDTSNQNRYVADSESMVQLDVPNAPASGTRTHRVVLRIRDKLHNSTWSTYDAALEVLEDDGTGLPALPDSAIPLARITVSSTTSAITTDEITDDRKLARKHASKHALDGVDPGPHATELIESVELTSDQDRIGFTSIPQHYRTLIIQWSGKHNGGSDGSTSDNRRVLMRFNASDANEYFSHLNAFINDGSTTIDDNRGVGYLNASLIGAPTADAGSSGVITIIGYSTGTSGRRGFHANGFATTGGGSTSNATWLAGGSVNNSNSVSSVQLFVTGSEFQFAPGTVVNLYGRR